MTAGLGKAMVIIHDVPSGSSTEPLQEESLHVWILWVSGLFWLLHRYPKDYYMYKCRI
jgi:hypothetical protein